jgi:hypothetical protein
MFRHFIIASTFVVALGAAALVQTSTTTAQVFITGPYFYDPTPPRAGYYYPGVPFANTYGPPYYQGYGAPYYQGYGPPYTRNFGRDYLFPRYPTYTTPYTATTNAYGYYGY